MKPYYDDLVRVAAVTSSAPTSRQVLEVNKEKHQDFQSSWAVTFELVQEVTSASMFQVSSERKRDASSRRQMADRRPARGVQTLAEQQLVHLNKHTPAHELTPILSSRFLSKKIHCSKPTFSKTAERIPSPFRGIYVSVAHSQPAFLPNTCVWPKDERSSSPQRTFASVEEWKDTRP